MTHDTPAIRRLFTPGRDLVVSSSARETLQLIRHYLDHPEECKSIREQGRLAVSNDTYQHRAEYMIRVLQEQGILPGEKQVVSTSEKLQAIPADSKEQHKKHRVQQGDTLYQLSKEYGVSVEQIKRLNQLASDMIYVDDCLKIKEEEAEDQAAEAAHEELYLVKRGDTLWKIAKMYGVSVEQLKSWNKLTSHLIYENQLLKVADDEMRKRQ